MEKKIKEYTEVCFINEVLFEVDRIIRKYLPSATESLFKDLENDPFSLFLEAVTDSTERAWAAQATLKQLVAAKLIEDSKRDLLHLSKETIAKLTTATKTTIEMFTAPVPNKENMN